MKSEIAFDLVSSAFRLEEASFDCGLISGDDYTADSRFTNYSLFDFVEELYSSRDSNF